MPDLEYPKEWRTSVSFPDYEVSESGLVRRKIPYLKSRVKAGGFNKPHLDKDGYERISLWMGSASGMIHIHHLVAESFIGPRPDGLEVNHKDGQKRHNHYSNLEYITQLENLAHKTRMGLCARGNRNGAAKITESDVIEMRRLARSGVAQKDIAKQFALGESTTHSILRGHIWSHVEGAFPSRRKPRKDRKSAQEVVVSQ